MTTRELIERLREAFQRETARADRLEAALKFYASGDADNGNIARAALAPVKPGETI